MRTRFDLAVLGFVVLGVVLVASGCGSGGEGVVKPPETAGDPALLEGTIWIDPESQTQYGFQAGGAMQMSSPATGLIVPGTFMVDNGIITINVGLQSIDGTWDGEKLVLNGKELTRQ